MGVDVGNKGGISIMVDNEFILQKFFNMISLKKTYDEIIELIKKYKVEAVVTGKPNRMYNIVLRHAQFIGVIGMACEEFDIPLVMVNDNTARADILGKGNGRKKDLVHEKYQGITPDVSDSMLFVDWMNKNQ